MGRGSGKSAQGVADLIPFSRSPMVTWGQQTATSEILGVIASSPTDIQPVFDTIVKNAARLCEGSGASVVRYDGEMVYLVAQYNISAKIRDAMQRMFPTPPTRQFGIA
jgi:two-component system, NtrC family, sensor kinase